MMEQWIEEFLAFRTIGVVGATDKKEKWGYKIFRRLLNEGYQVVPIHPKLQEIEGEACYPSLQEAPDGIEGIDVVVPPSAVRAVMEDALACGIGYVWLQPGAESQETIEFGTQHGLKVIHHHCILQELNARAKG